VRALPAEFNQTLNEDEIIQEPSFRSLELRMKEKNVFEITSNTFCTTKGNKLFGFLSPCGLWLNLPEVGENILFSVSKIF